MSGEYQVIVHGEDDMTITSEMATLSVFGGIGYASPELESVSVMLPDGTLANERGAEDVASNTSIALTFSKAVIGRGDLVHGEL